MTIKNNTENLMKLSSYLSVLTAIVILSLKLYGWVITDLASILASLVDSLLDVSASIVNMFAIRYSLQPPDNQHRFGHDKIQDLAVFAQSIFIGASSLFIFFTSLKKISTYSAIENYDTGLIIMVISIILTTMLVVFQTYVTNRTKSNVIEADKLHYLADLMTNCAVVISIYLSSKYNLPYLDAAFAILIAIYIFYSSYSLCIKSIKNLVDEEFNDQERALIINIISANDKVKGIHELKTRYAGVKPFIQCHLEFDGNLTLYEAHDITDNIIVNLEKAFPNSEIIIHQDPAGVERNVAFQEILYKK